MEYRFGGSQFFRDNYAVESNGVHAFQAHFVTARKGYALVFVFIGEDQTSVDEMTKAMDTFDFPPGRRGVTTVTKPKHESRP